MTTSAIRRVRNSRRRSTLGAQVDEWAGVQPDRARLYLSHYRPLLGYRRNRNPPRTDPIDIQVPLCVDRRVAEQLWSHGSKHIVQKVSFDSLSGNETYDTVRKAGFKVENGNIANIRSDSHD